ncbi:MAG TPA: hypothetical protein DHU89_08945 [Flavobacteriales bacterium]|nr:hypothetical protein [Flavobacteriales bacterium]
MYKSITSPLLALICMVLIACQPSSREGGTKQNTSQKTEDQTISHTLDYIELELENYEEWAANIKNPQEVPANITYFSSDKEVFSSPVGVRLSGIFIKKMPQKSISVEFSKKTYGSTKSKHNIWPNREYDDVDGFVIRAHGNPLKNTFYLDGLANLLLEEYTDLEYSSHEPVILYLNGKYQGLFNLREKKNKDFINNLYDLGKENIELLEITGGRANKVNQNWLEMFNHCKNKDLTTAENYEFVKDRIDIENFIDYHISETFLANIDWPMANVKVWRKKGGKWRWLFFDCDRGLQNIKFNSLEHITGLNQWDKERVNARLNAASTMIRALMKNLAFREQFLIRYQDLLNSAFNPETSLALSKKLKTLIEPEVGRQISYWKDKKNEFSYNTVESLSMWEENIGFQDRFLKERPKVIYKQLGDSYELGEIYTISFEVEDKKQGKIKVNTAFLPKAKFVGKYFKNLPLSIEAVPETGYNFDHWEGCDSKKKIINPTSKSLQGKQLKAVFVKV